MGPKELRRKALARQQEIVDVAKNDGRRDLSSEEQTEFDNLQRDIEGYTALIALEEKDATGSSERQAGATAERERISQITDMCRSFDIDAKPYIEDGSQTVDTVRAVVIDKLQREHPPIGTRGTGEANVGADADDKFRAAMADALVMRGGVNIETPADGARDLMGMSLRDLAIECLQKSGESNLNRCATSDLYERLLNQRAFFNPSNSFPSIMDTAINKAYVEGHKNTAVTFDKWTKKGTLHDFKTIDNNYLAGPAGEFLEVPEGGELKHDIPTDEKRPTRKLKTYGRQFTMTRQAFINDDIGFLSKVPAKYAASARKTINKQCYQILINNPAVYDGVKLFNSTHKNVLAEGTGITRESVQKMLMALQMQIDEFGESIIIRPATIIVPIGYAFDIYALFNSATINTSSNTQATNPLFKYKDSIEVVEDPTINVLCGSNAMPWFIVGDKNDTDFVEVDYLNGQEIPTIRRMEQAGTLGFVWDIYLDWGISVMDWRGAIKNPGTTIANPLA